MKIVLINCLFGIKSISMPLGICALAAYIRQEGYTDTHIYDPCLNGDSVLEATKVVLSSKCDVLCVSIITSENKDFIRLITEIRKYDKTVNIIVGGHGPSVSPERFLIDGVQGVIQGEGEKSLLELLNCISNGKDYRTIPGFVIKDEHEEIHTTPAYRKIQNIDQLPFIARDTLPNLIEKYSNNIFVPIFGSRGCYMNCHYCSIKAYSKIQAGPAYRERSLTSVFDEIRYLYKEYGVRKFDFVDDNFIPPLAKKAREKIDNFCKIASNLNIDGFEFFLQCRPDNVDIDSFRNLLKIGLRGIFIGIESVNQDDLLLYGKNSTSEQNKNVMKGLHDIGLSCDINARYRIKTGFICFNPFSTKKSLSNNLEFLRQYNITPKKYVTILSPLIKTQIYEECRKRNLLLEDGKIDFLDQEIKEIFTYSLAFHNLVWDFRERVRMPYKMYIELKKDIQNAMINDYRVMLDQLCYQAYDALLNCNHEDINGIYNLYTERFQKYKEDASLLKYLHEAEESCSINSTNYKHIHMK